MDGPRSLERLRALVEAGIPLAGAMEATIRSWDGTTLQVAAPLGPNANHHGTFFGGSAAALGILAGWSLVHLVAEEDGLDADLVIQRAAVRYLAPGGGDLVARARVPDPADRARFGSGYRRRGLARIRVRVGLHLDGELVATVDAAYAAVRPEPTP